MISSGKVEVVAGCWMIRVQRGKEIFLEKVDGGRSFGGDDACGKGVVAVVVAFVEVAALDPVSCSMGKALRACNDADVIDDASFVTEKNKVAGAEAVFGYNGAERGKFTGGSWQNHLEVFFVEIEHEP